MFVVAPGRNVLPRMDELEVNAIETAGNKDKYSAQVKLLAEALEHDPWCMLWEITVVDVYLRAIFLTFFLERGDRSIEPNLHNSSTSLTVLD